MTSKPHAPGVMGIMAASLAEQRNKALSDAQGRLERVFDDDDFEPASAPASVVSIAAEKQAPKPPSTKASKSDDTVYLLDPNDIEPWVFADRPDNEFGDLTALTEKIRVHGQEVPALVRPGKTKGKYELIYGRRRWTVCKDLGIKLKTFVRDLNDQDAHARMVIENERDPVSTWAKAMNYKKVIEAGVYPSESALAAKLGIHRASLSNIMAYNRIPAPVVEALGADCMSSMGIHTAKAILAASKSEKDIEVLVANASKIASGSITGENILKLVNKAKEVKPRETKIVTDDQGRKLFSFRTTGRGMTEVMFYQEATKRFAEEDLVSKIKELFSK